MANASYAPNGSGPYASSIGWVVFPTVALAANASNVITTTFKDGSTMTFTLTNSPVLGAASISGLQPPTFPGAPFGGVGGYAGVVGRVVLRNTASATFTLDAEFSNIVVKDPFGVTVPNYTIVTGDGEATGAAGGETLKFTTDGSPWFSIGNIGSGTSGTFSGLGTTIVNDIGSGNTFHSLILATNNPSNVTVNLHSGGGLQGTMFGLLLTKIQVSKVVNSRAFATDQFNISISGATSTSTITTGISTGIQTEKAALYITTDSIVGSTFTINETMAPGSGGPLTNYATVIQNGNLTAGGTTVPATGFLGESITAKFGDIMLTTIVNNPIPSVLTTTKIVDQSSALAGSTITYTILFNNSGPLDIQNAVFKDTIPSGTTFVPNSVTFNGSPILGTVAPPTGITITTLPAGVTSTLTFQVTTLATLPVGTIITNNSSTIGVNNLVPIPITLSSNSNSIKTTIAGGAIINSSKSVDSNYSSIGDVLTYTIPMVNSGNASSFNIIFIDTIPNGTTLVPGTLTQDGIPISGGLSGAGVTLPNSIAVGATSTIVYKLVVTTIPNPNTIENSASFTFSFIADGTTIPPIIEDGSSNTNVVQTLVEEADLSGTIKSVDKSYVTCGDVVTYTIVIPNSGNTTALNVNFTDTVPTGIVFVPDSIILDGVVQTGSDPQTGITISQIVPGGVSTVTFKGVVNC